MFGGLKDNGEREANAKLVASAPELLAALEAITEMYETAMSGTYDDPDEAEVVDRAFNAIANAKAAAAVCGKSAPAARNAGKE